MKSSKLLFALVKHPELDLVHFACHGEAGSVHLAPDPSLGAGANAEVLTADEILRRRIRAALVTVSACDSGLGQLEASDEVLGLPRALLYSGARLVQILERVLSSRFTVVVIEHTAKSFAAMNRIIG